jgi:hypothetical protein
VEERVKPRELNDGKERIEPPTCGFSVQAAKPLKPMIDKRLSLALAVTAYSLVAVIAKHEGPNTCLHTAGATGSIPVPPTINQKLTAPDSKKYGISTA